MTHEKLDELEKLEAAATPGEWVHSDVISVALRNNARDLFAALREAWRERDEALKDNALLREIMRLKESSTREVG
jgi:hypothetical protein